MSSQTTIITIDGPAGAGKSTIARSLADRLGFVYLDTGAIYRTVALAAQRVDTNWCDQQAVAQIARELSQQQRLAFCRGVDGTQTVMLDGVDVSEDIRAPAISAGASTVSAHPAVRAELLQLQRDLAQAQRVVVEGRDTGTVVFPRAIAKFFLTASESERARRRYEELTSKGMRVSLEGTLHEIQQRDQRDVERDVAPLRRADDAMELDTTGLSIDEVLDQLVARLEPVLER